MQVIIYLFLSKAKHKEKDEVAGGIISLKCIKNRDVKPETKIKILLHFEHGLHKYYGLLPYALEAGIVSKEGTRWVYEDKKHTEAKMYSASMCKKIFSEENLQKIDVLIKKEFAYGSGGSLEDLVELADSEEEVEDDKKS